MGLCVVEMWAETQTTSRRTRDPARVEREDESTPLLTRHLDSAHASAQLRFAMRSRRTKRTPASFGPQSHLWALAV